MEELTLTAEEARRYYDAGTIAVAELICRERLAKEPRDAECWALLSRIAADLGEPRLAVEYAQRATVADPESQAARASLDSARALPAPTRAAPGGPERFLLIKAWGNGFFSDVDQVLGNLLLAEMTGRTPIIHWGRNSLFGTDPEQDAWRLYFDPVSPHSIDDLAGKGLDFWPPKWNDANLRQENNQKLAGEWSRMSGLAALHRPERVVVVDYFNGVPHLLHWLPPGHPLQNHANPNTAYRYLIDKYLRPRADILQEIEAFAGWFLQPDAGGRAPLIAAHVRAGDKWKDDPQLDQKNAYVPRLVQQFGARHPSFRLFLLTDSTVARDAYASMFGPRLITTDALRTPDRFGVHYKKEHTDRRRIGAEVLKDAYLAARCDYFIGIGSSNVTCFIYHLKPWTAQNCVLVGPLMTHMANPYLYMNHDQLARYLPPDQIERLRAMS